jgi:hypothetical protein
MRFQTMLMVSAACFFCAGAALAQDVDAMQFADTNGDGKVTAEEYAAFSEQAWGYFAHGADKFKVADVDPTGKGLFASAPKDADGYVTKAAFMAAAPARFKAADKNGDGVLDAAELNASIRGG